MPRPPRPQRRQFEAISNMALLCASDHYWGDASEFDESEGIIDGWLYPELNREACQEIWRVVHGPLLFDWIRARPGRRPSWWWLFSAPPMSAAEIVAHNWDTAWFAQHA
jgi:hypothetical protein